MVNGDDGGQYELTSSTWLENALRDEVINYCQREGYGSHVEEDSGSRTEIMVEVDGVSYFVKTSVTAVTPKDLADFEGELDEFMDEDLDPHLF